MSVGSFLQYNNIVPIALSFVTLSFGAAFAASDDVRNSVYDSSQSVVAIDNTYIANVDLNSFTPKAQVQSVTEDAEMYYVAYEFTTISVDDGVWKDVVRSDIMRVSKAALGEYRDLGLFVMDEFSQKIDREISYLQEVQQIERRQVSQKQVATEYSGLIGALFTDSIETVPGYVPVVAPRVVPETPIAQPEMPAQGSLSQPVTVNNPNGPTIRILGNNPARVPVGAQYVDLGATVDDDKDRNLGIYLKVDGIETVVVQIDTSAAKEFTITYSATDTDGNTTTVERRVIVGNPQPAVEPALLEAIVATTSESEQVPTPIVPDEQVSEIIEPVVETVVEEPVVP